MTEIFETVDRLALDCQDFAERNGRYKSGDSDRYERSVTLDVPADDVIWRASFSAQRCYDDGRFEGHSFKLFINCISEVGVVPAAMRIAALVQKEELPDDDVIGDVSVQYHAMYELSQWGSLGWMITRDYEYIFDDPDPDDPHEKEEGVVSETLSTHVPEKWKYDAEDTADDNDIIRQMETEMHLAQARKVFRMVSHEVIDGMDLASIMSEEVMQEIEE